MGVFSGPEINENGLILCLDAANQKSLNIPSQSDHGYADWYCLVSGTATYSIINSSGGIIYEKNGSTITGIVTASSPQRGTISVTAGRSYYGSVPINLVVEDQQHSIAPLTMVGTQFWNVAGRTGVTPSTYYVYSPYQTATVNFYDGSANGLVGIATSTITVNAGGTGTFSSSTNNNHWISSNVPVIASATQNGADKTILSPMSTYVYQRFQNWLNTTNNTTPTNNNAYVTYDSTYKVMNMNIADGSGGDCAQGLGLEYLSNTYSWGNVVSDYTMVFPYNGTFTASYWSGSAWVVWDTHTITTGSITNPPRITRDGTNGPGVEASAIQGLSTNMASGATLWKWEGTSPFYLCINDSADDEFSVLGWNSSTQNTPRSGNTITNISGVSNNGTLLNGPFFIKDNSGGLSFDGVDDYISFVSNPSITNQITVEVWVNLSATVASSGWILGREGSYRILYSSGGFSWICATTNNSWYSVGTVVSANVSATSGIYHVVATFDGTNNRIYVNGTLRNTAANISGNILNTGTYNLMFDSSGDPSIDNGRGIIYSHRLYNRALSASEIQQNFNATRGRFGV